MTSDSTSITTASGRKRRADRWKDEAKPSLTIVEARKDRQDVSPAKKQRLPVEPLPYPVYLVRVPQIQEKYNKLRATWSKPYDQQREYYLELADETLLLSRLYTNPRERCCTYEELLALNLVMSDELSKRLFEGRLFPEKEEELFTIEVPCQTCNPWIYNAIMELLGAELRNIAERRWMSGEFFLQLTYAVSERKCHPERLRYEYGEDGMVYIEQKQEKELFGHFCSYAMNIRMEIEFFMENVYSNPRLKDYERRRETINLMWRFLDVVSYKGTTEERKAARWIMEWLKSSENVNRMFYESQVIGSFHMQIPYEEVDPWIVNALMRFFGAKPAQYSVDSVIYAPTLNVDDEYSRRSKYSVWVTYGTNEIGEFNEIANFFRK